MSIPFDKIPHRFYVKLADTRVKHQLAAEQFGPHHPTTQEALNAHHQAALELAEAIKQQKEAL